jgi:hypothetical protein
LKKTVSVHFLSDGYKDSNYICHEGMQVKFKYGCSPIIIGGNCIFIHLQHPQNC